MMVDGIRLICGGLRCRWLLFWVVDTARLRLLRWPHEIGGMLDSRRMSIVERLVVGGTKDDVEGSGRVQG